MFLVHHILQLLLVPCLHRVTVLVVSTAGVMVQAALLLLTFDRQIVRELAAVALSALALLEERTDHGLGIGTRIDLLRLHGLEDGSQLPLLLQLLLLLFLLGIRSKEVVGAATLHLLLDLDDELLLLGALLVLQAERLVLNT